MGTDALARAAAEEIGRRLGGRPFLVVSNVTRRQFDANRPEAIGVEPFGPDGGGARAAYRAYHAGLASARGEILRRWGSGLLLDLHGQGSEAGTVFRGTANGRTVAHPAEVLGREGLLGALEARGWRMFPACGAEGAKENPSLDGGWIVRHYGARSEGESGRSWATPEAFDAVQLEFGIAYRRPGAVAGTASALGEAVAGYVRRWTRVGSPGGSPGGSR